MFGHVCCKCGGACDCMAFDISHGDVCDGCSDCAVAEVEVYEAELTSGPGAPKACPHGKGFHCPECRS